MITAVTGMSVAALGFAPRAGREEKPDSGLREPDSYTSGASNPPTGVVVAANDAGAAAAADSAAASVDETPKDRVSVPSSQIAPIKKEAEKQNSKAISAFAPEEWVADAGLNQALLKILLSAKIGIGKTLFSKLKTLTKEEQEAKKIEIKKLEQKLQDLQARLIDLGEKLATTSDPIEKARIGREIAGITLAIQAISTYANSDAIKTDKIDIAVKMVDGLLDAADKCVVGLEFDVEMIGSAYTGVDSALRKKFNITTRSLEENAQLDAQLTALFTKVQDLQSKAAKLRNAYLKEKNPIVREVLRKRIEELEAAAARLLALPETEEFKQASFDQALAMTEKCVERLEWPIISMELNLEHFRNYLELGRDAVDEGMHEFGFVLGYVSYDSEAKQSPMNSKVHDTYYRWVCKASRGELQTSTTFGQDAGDELVASFGLSDASDLLTFVCKSDTPKPVELIDGIHRWFGGVTARLKIPGQNIVSIRKMHPEELEGKEGAAGLLKDAKEQSVHLSSCSAFVFRPSKQIYQAILDSYKRFLGIGNLSWDELLEIFAEPGMPMSEQFVVINAKAGPCKLTDSEKMEMIGQVFWTALEGQLTFEARKDALSGQRQLEDARRNDQMTAFYHGLESEETGNIYGLALEDAFLGLVLNQGDASSGTLSLEDLSEGKGPVGVKKEAASEELRTNIRKKVDQIRADKKASGEN
ncbi:MAG: hypothetical protein ABIA67_03950 [Candidatus Margulisiibacteriota bacterium]